MSMELKDVFHFYLGCEVKTNDVVSGDQVIKHGRVGTFIGYTDRHRLSARVLFRAGPEGDCNVMMLRPILRHLNSMTEADCPDWFKTWMPNGFDVNWQVSNSHGYIEVDSRADDGYLLTISQDGSMNCECKDNGEQYEYRGAELFAHLLSRGFDLFGLIKSGKAIDATSLTQQ